jgi:hypothetical protein
LPCTGRRVRCCCLPCTGRRVRCCCLPCTGRRVCDSLTTADPGACACGRVPCLLCVMSRHVSCLLCVMEGRVATLAVDSRARARHTRAKHRCSARLQRSRDAARTPHRTNTPSCSHAPPPGALTKHAKSPPQAALAVCYCLPHCMCACTARARSARGMRPKLSHRECLLAPRCAPATCVRCHCRVQQLGGSHKRHARPCSRLAVSHTCMHARRAAAARRHTRCSDLAAKISDHTQLDELWRTHKPAAAAPHTHIKCACCCQSPSPPPPGPTGTCARSRTPLLNQPAAAVRPKTLLLPPLLARHVRKCPLTPS